MALACRESDEAGIPHLDWGDHVLAARDKVSDSIRELIGLWDNLPPSVT